MSNTLTQTELKEWMDTLDMTNNSTKRVIAGIQLLHPQLLSDITYYLAKGFTTIDIVAALDINNSTIEILLNSIKVNMDIPLNRVIFYKNVVKGMDSYKRFMLEKTANNQLFISRFSVSPYRLARKIIIDNLGLRENTYRSLVEVRRIYDGITKLPSVLLIISNALAKATAISNNPDYNFSNFINLHNKIIKDIKDYYFIYTDNVNALPLKCKYEEVVGRIARDAYLDIPFDGLIDNSERIFNAMASHYDTDVNKLGIPALNELMLSCKWNYITAPSNIALPDSNIINDIQFNTLLFYTFVTKIYGATYFDITLVNAQTKLFVKMQEYFSIIAELTKVVRAECNTRFYEV